MVHRKYMLLISCVFVILLVSCQQNTPVPTPDLNAAAENAVRAEAFDGNIEWVECPFDADQGAPQCGYLALPFDAQTGNGDTFRLAFAIYKTANPAPQPDPLVIVSGSATLNRSGFVVARYGNILEDRDVIVFDMRGTGLSEPTLTCPELPATLQDTTSGGWLSAEQWTSAYEQCRQTWEGRSLNLDVYTFANLAADLQALRLALGYPRWNIAAVDTVGATMGYQQLQIDPEGVRSIVLSGALPIFTGQTQDYADVQQVLKEFFDLCIQDTQCHETYPDPENTFYKVAGQLNARPVQVTATNLSSGDRRETTIDGDRFVELVLSVIVGGRAENMGLLPRMIYQMQDGNTEVLAQLAGNSFGGISASYDALSSLLQCRQGAPEDGQAAAGLSNLSPEVARYFQARFNEYLATCEAWQPLPGTPSPAASSAKPILLIRGGWNWISTPSANVEQFKQLAPGIQVVTLPMTGRASLFSRNSSGCTQSIVAAFIEMPDARVDTKCVQANLQITWITMH